MQPTLQDIARGSSGNLRVSLSSGTRTQMVLCRQMLMIETEILKSDVPLLSEVFRMIEEVKKTAAHKLATRKRLAMPSKFHSKIVHTIIVCPLQKSRRRRSTCGLAVAASPFQSSMLFVEHINRERIISVLQWAKGTALPAFLLMARCRSRIGEGREVSATSTNSVLSIRPPSQPASGDDRLLHRITLSRHSPPAYVVVCIS